MRKLASIQKIESIRSIEGADNIECAKVLGWNVVIKKGDFKENDFCIYCEIDSVLPDEPEFKFLENRGFRIKTIKLKSQISQGICFPLSILIGKTYGNSIISSIRTILPGQPVTVDFVPSRFDAYIGRDVTNIIGIEKYEPPIPTNLSGIAKGSFPVFLIKTDETRIQSIPEIIDENLETEYFITEKLDGTSMTCYIKDFDFGVCSRNLELLESDDNSLWNIVKRDFIKETMVLAQKDFGNFAIQGELIGPGIQNNKYKLTEHKYKVFRIFSIDNGRFFNDDETSLFFSHFGSTIDRVPIIGKFKLKDIGTNIDEIINFTIKKSLLNLNIWQEGFVFSTFNRDRQSFKVINPQFLLKYEDS